MSLESILEKIGREAGAERERILGDARRRADKIKAGAEREARAEAEILLKKAAQDAELEAHRLITQARLEQKLHILDLKKQLVEEVLEKAFARQEAGTLTMKKRIVLKDGEQEESLDLERIKQELRPSMENTIADLLKL